MSTIDAHITGTVWRVLVEVGQDVAIGDEVVILESMKMEMPVEAESAGRVEEVLCAEGDAVNEGQPVVRLA